MTEHIEKIREAGFMAGLNLAIAVQDAGGSVSALADEIAGGMTLADFVSRVAAPNGIRFRFVELDAEKREEPNHAFGPDGG